MTALTSSRCNSDWVDTCTVENIQIHISNTSPFKNTKSTYFHQEELPKIKTWADLLKPDCVITMEAPEDTNSSTDKLTADIQEVLEQAYSKTISVNRYKFSNDFLKSLFEQRQLVWSFTDPRRLVILNDRNYSNSVVIEEISQTRSTVNLRIRSSCNSFGGFLESKFEENYFFENLKICLSMVERDKDNSASMIDTLQILKSTSCMSFHDDEYIGCFIVSECPVCLSPPEDSVAETFGECFTTLTTCGHSICNSCLVNHIMRCMDSGILAIKCPKTDCEWTLDLGTILVFSDPDYIPKWISKFN